MNAKGSGNVMVKLYDAAPDGTAVRFDEQVSLVDSGLTAFDLKSTDWTLAAGHALAVEIGTPSRETIRVRDARLTLELDDPADDTATAGDRAPCLLMLDDRTGIPAGAGTLHYALGGAVLVELALRGRAETDGAGALNGPPGSSRWGTGRSRTRCSSPPTTRSPSSPGGSSRSSSTSAVASTSR